MNSERWGGHGGCGLELATPDNIGGNSAGGILPFQLLAARDRFGEIESGPPPMAVRVAPTTKTSLESTQVSS